MGSSNNMGNFVTVFAPKPGCSGIYRVVSLLVMFPSNTYVLTSTDKKPVWHESYLFGLRQYDVVHSNCAHIFDDIPERFITKCDPTFASEFEGKYASAKPNPWTYVQEFPSKHNPYGHIGIMFNVIEGVYVIDNTPRYDDRMIPFDQREHVPTRFVQPNAGLTITKYIT